MKKVLKLVAVILAIVIALPVGLAMFLVLINLQDDQLDPAAASVLAAVPEQIADERNGYFAWVGVLGPADQLPAVWGYRWYQEVLQQDKRAQAGDHSLAINVEVRQETLRAADIPCAAIDACLLGVRKRPAVARRSLEKGRITLERGDMALAMPGYQEAWRPDYSVTSLSPPYAYRYRELSATRFALDVAEGRYDQALNRLGQLVSFHARQAQGATTLIEKVLALASLQRDFLLVNQFVLDAPKVARNHLDQLDALLAPLPEGAVRLTTALESEFRGTARLFQSLGSEVAFAAPEGMLGPGLLPRWLGKALVRRLYLPQASINAHFALYRGLFAAEGQAAGDYRLALADARHRIESATESVFAVRNPVGHILVRLAANDYRKLYLRRDDVLALQAMVRFQLARLRRNESDGESIIRALPDAGLAHPHTGALPHWDEAHRRLSHAALPERGGGGLEVAL